MTMGVDAGPVFGTVSVMLANPACTTNDDVFLSGMR